MFIVKQLSTDTTAAGNVTQFFFRKQRLTVCCVLGSVHLKTESISEISAPRQLTKERNQTHGGRPDGPCLKAKKSHGRQLAPPGRRLLCVLVAVWVRSSTHTPRVCSRARGAMPVEEVALALHDSSSRARAPLIYIYIIVYTTVPTDPARGFRRRSPEVEPREGPLRDVLQRQRLEPAARRGAQHAVSRGLAMGGFCRTAGWRARRAGSDSPKQADRVPVLLDIGAAQHYACPSCGDASSTQHARQTRTGTYQSDFLW